MKEEILKIIDGFIKQKESFREKSMSFYAPAQFEVLKELREKVCQLEPPVGMPEPNPSFGQWVEAEYKLPDDGEEVIFINPDKHIRIGEYSDDEFMQGYWVNKCEQYLTKDIKRWMPLPKP